MSLSRLALSCWTLATLLVPACRVLAEPTPAGTPPTVTISAKAELLGDVLARVHQQTNILVAAEPFASRRRITVEISAKPVAEALDQLAMAAVATWDSAYLLTPTGGPYGPQTAPPEWVKPPQVALTLAGGSGPVGDMTRVLTNLSGAPVGCLPTLEHVRIATQPGQNAPLEEVLSHIQGQGVTWTRGFWLASIDRAAVFARYANLPVAEREAAVLRHAQQMLQLNKTDVRDALVARHREIAALNPDEREKEIQRYADEVRAGVAVLNSLSPQVRVQARKAMQVFSDMGLDVYRDLTEEEQLETTPIIEAMGELKR